MKNKANYILLVLVLFICSCRDEPTSGSSVPACNWTSEEDVGIENIALRAPDGMSSFYYGALPADRVMRNLQHPLWLGNFWSTKNEASINGNLKPDGTACTGEPKAFEFAEGNNKIGSNYLRLPAPSNARFFGIVTMSIRSDDYKTASDPNNAEYVVWAGTGTNPDYPTVNGTITGSRKTYRPSTGKLTPSGKDGGCYYLSGEKICP